MQADFLCPPCPLRPRLEVLSPLGGSPRPDLGCVCVCTRAHACVHGRSSEAEVRNASPTSPFRPGFSRCQGSGSLGLSPGAVGGWAGGGAFLAGATADSCAVSVPRAGSVPALCSVRAWSQTAPLFSCWSCWEAGRLDGGHGLEGETQGARGSLARVCAP